MTFFNEIVKARHGSFVINKNDTYIGRSLKNYGEWSEEEIKLLKQICKKGDTVIEAGSNIGAHSIPLAQTIEEKGNFYGFEPQKILFQSLSHNIALNNLTNAKVYLKAVSNIKEEILVPQLNPNETNNFGGLSLLDSKEGEVVESVTLDEFLFDMISSNKNNKLKLIKADVEGFESKVLEGAKNLIKKFRPFLYLENDKKEKSKELIELVFSYGYKLYWHFVPIFCENNYFNNSKNLFSNIISFNMFGVHTSININLEEKWKKLEVVDSKYHPLNKD